MRWVLFVVILGFVACVTLPPPPTGPATLQEAARRAPEGQIRASIHLVARADQALGQGDLGAARELASRALRIDGQNPYAYFLLAQVAVQSGEHPAALRYLDEAELRFRADEPPNLVWLDRALRLEAELMLENER